MLQADVLATAYLKESICHLRTEKYTFDTDCLADVCTLDIIRHAIFPTSWMCVYEQKQRGDNGLSA
jgi:hypothetical protein